MNLDKHFIHSALDVPLINIKELQIDLGLEVGNDYNNYVNHLLLSFSYQLSLGFVVGDFR